MGAAGAHAPTTTMKSSVSEINVFKVWPRSAVVAANLAMWLYREKKLNTNNTRRAKREWVSMVLLELKSCIGVEFKSTFEKQLSNVNKTKLVFLTDLMNQPLSK